MQIRVGSLLDFSTIDWPDHTTFLIFCSGCNFHCPFCDNSPLIPIDSGGNIDLLTITERVTANLGFVDAIGFTGGEPSLQPDPVKALCEWAKAQGIKTFLNTNGSNPTFIDEMLRHKLLDYIAIDVKAPFNCEAFGQMTGVRNNDEEIMVKIKETLALCARANFPMEVRTTTVPTLIDDELSVRSIATVVRRGWKYVLQEYFPFEGVSDERLRRVNPPARKLMFRLARVALETGLTEVYIRTRRKGMERIVLDN